MAGVIQRAYGKLSDIEAEEEAPDPTAEERAAWESIKDIELTLRQLVWTHYRSKWGEGAVGQIRRFLGAEAWDMIEKNRSKRPDQPSNAAQDSLRELLQFTYLGQLVQLMVVNEAWEMFKPMFRDKRELEDLIRKITPVRNDAAHFRTVPVKQLRSCQAACEELRTLLSAGGIRRR